MIDSKGDYLLEYQHVRTIKADFSGICTDNHKRKGTGGEYWHIDFKIGMCFGGTSMKAWIFRTEGGVEKKVIPAAYH